MNEFVFWTADAGDVDNSNKEVLALTFVSSALSAPQVKEAIGNHSNITSNYHNITSLKVPIAESESDLELPVSEDEEEEEEEEERLSQVRFHYLNFSVLILTGGFCQFSVIRH